MKYIRKDGYLINVDKCVNIRVNKYNDFTGALNFGNENDYMYFWYEKGEQAEQDMMKIEEFITNEERLLKL